MAQPLSKALSRRTSRGALREDAGGHEALALLVPVSMTSDFVALPPRLAMQATSRPPCTLRGARSTPVAQRWPLRFTLVAANFPFSDRAVALALCLRVECWKTVVGLLHP